MSRWRAKVVVLVALSSGFAESQVRTKAAVPPFPACPLSAGVQQIPWPATPMPLKAAVSKHIGTFAMPGEPFDITDVTVGEPQFQRLIFVRHRADRWIVAVEHGGIAYRVRLFGFALTSREGEAVLLQQRTAQKPDVCTASQDMLLKRPLPDR